MPTLPDIPAADFAWDQSHVGTYDPSAAATFVALLNGGGEASASTNTSAAPSPAGAGLNDLQSGLSASADLIGGIMEQKKWGPQGGAPMFNTPNCELFCSIGEGKTELMSSLVALVPNGRGAQSDSTLLCQRGRSDDGHSIRLEPDASYQSPLSPRFSQR